MCAMNDVRDCMYRDVNLQGMHLKNCLYSEMEYVFLLLLLFQLTSSHSSLDFKENEANRK
jgi:hypothetical protein